MAALATLVAVLALLASMAPVSAQEQPRGEPVTVAAIVEGPDGPVVERHAAASAAQGRRLAESLQARDDVVVAEVDVPVRAMQEPVDPQPIDTPADPVDPSQEAGDPFRSEQWALDRLQAETAWETMPDARGRIVAVVDSGVDATHPDLEGVVLDGFDTLNPATRGRVDPLVPCPGLPSECRGHGTHVAGVIAALVDNEIGIAGLAPGASILPVRVLDPAGFGSASDVAAGVLFAADNGASVINLSLGSDEASGLVDFAVAYATRRGALVIAAAGNMGAFSPVVHPAADPWTLAVGATDRDDSVVSFSGQGAWLDLVAPGVEILSTRPTATLGAEDYGFDTGTSMATPHVAAAAALVQRRHPLLSPMGVAAHLRATAMDLSPAGRDRVSGDGLLHLVNALTRAPADFAVCDPRRMPASAFLDAGTGVHRPSIDCAVWFGVAQGTSATTFRPAEQVTRGQMASFVARMLDRSGVRLRAAAGQRFNDVGPANVHFETVNQLAEAGIVQGQDAVTFAPNRVVTRAQMASFLVRAHDYAQTEMGRFALPPAAGRFVDTVGSTHEANINKAAAAGLTTGITPTEYAPSRGVRRDQMASFVIRTMEHLAG